MLHGEKILLITPHIEKTPVITGNVYFHFWGSYSENKIYLQWRDIFPSCSIPPHNYKTACSYKTRAIKINLKEIF